MVAQQELQGVMPTPESFQRGNTLILLHQMARVVHVSAALGLPDLLIGGSRTAGDIALEIGAHEQSLHRLMRASASFGFYTMDEEGRFGLTVDSAAFRRDVQGSLRPLTLLFGAEPFEAYKDLLQAVKTGESAFALANGDEFFPFIANHPPLAQTFNSAMTGRSEGRSAAIIDAYNFSQHSTIVDIGGGQGGLLAAILRANPGSRGVLFDLPQVVETSGSVIEGFGVADRLAVEGGDFFERVPDGGDAYILATVLHDWGDEKAINILSRCRAGINRDGRVLIIDMLIPDRLQTGQDGLIHPVYSYDLHMMVINGRGKERTQAEFADIYRRGGFALINTYATRVPGLTIIEGKPV